MELAMWKCLDCLDVYIHELPPIGGGLELMPTCCGIFSVILTTRQEVESTVGRFSIARLLRSTTRELVD